MAGVFQPNISPEVERDSLLLFMPGELFNEHVFPYLKTNDLLRLRRTCQLLKVYSEDYMRNHAPLSTQVREINDKDHTFKDYIELDLPTSYIYVNNSGPQFYENSHIPEFLRLYSSKITHLRVKQFSTCETKAEHKFFLGLTNLKHLKIESIDAKHKAPPRASGSSGGVAVRSCYFPPTFRNLRYLALNEIQISSLYDCEYCWDFLHFCRNLEYFRYPYYTCNKQVEPVLVIGLCKVLLYIYERQRDFPNEPNLNFYDCRHHRRNGLLAENTYLEFVRVCCFNNVRLLNVNAEQHNSLEAVADTPDLDEFFRNVALCIVSLENISGSLVTEISYLEKLVITNTSQCSFRRLRNGQLPYLDFDWPNLQFLDITIDSTHLGPNLAGERHPTSHLEAFLFSSVPRPNLRDLKVRYKECTEVEAPFICLREGDLVRRCRNITQITLTNWLGDNTSLATLWTGLLQLEEVTLENCANLGNAGFIGENRDEPVFLELSKIRKLALIGLDKMPKITDLVFDLVFCRLHLKEFYLQSSKPVKSVTIAGIQALLMGEFRDSIERFPFQGWSLDNVSLEELGLLQKQFRSEYML